MNAHYQQHEYIDAYLRGALNEQEAEIFEIQLMEDSSLQQELQISLALRDGLASIQVDSVVQSDYDLQSENGVVHGKSILSGIGRWLPLGATAFSSLAVGVLLALTVVRNGPSNDISDIGTIVPDVPIMTFSRLRSATQDTSYSYVIDSALLKSEIAVLELEVDFPTMLEYRVIIASQSETQGSPTEVVVKPNERGYLVVALPSSYFAPGDYDVTVIPSATESTNAEVKQLDYSLRVN